MSNISYFQRYSQKENHITNNTLLVLRHFYRASTQKFENILSGLIEDNSELSIGPIFNQQERMKVSIPDAVIHQAPLSIFIEAKTGDHIDREQLLRHIESIENSQIPHSDSFLIALTVRPISEEILDELGRNTKVKLASTTYKDVIDSLRRNCQQHETELSEILDDYVDFISRENLLPSDILTAFPCGVTIRENIKHRIYFQPSFRPSKSDSKYIGLYARKSISYIGRIDTIVVGKMEKDGSFIEQDIEKGNLSDERRHRLRASIEDCHQHYGTFAENEHRYYLFEEMHETAFNKSSKGGMMNLRNFDLADYIENYSQKYLTEEVANKLRGKTWA